MSEPLDNKIIMITGASSGLGKSLAKRLSSEKAKLVLLTRSAEKLQDIIHGLRSSDIEVSCFACNVVDIQQIKNAVEYVMEAYGRIDVLINCAAIWNEGQPENYTENRVKELFDVNTIGVISMITEVLPVMKKVGHGQIINVVSEAGIRPYRDSSVYSSTKSAVHGFTESVQKELAGGGIRLTGIYPGGGIDAELFNTVINSSLPEERPNADKLADMIAYILAVPESFLIRRLEVEKI